MVVIARTAPELPGVAQGLLLDLLLPFWQLLIGGLVLIAVLVSVRRLASRGFSRMTTGLLVSAAAIVALASIGIWLQGF
jgi:hypothetical protein